MSKTTLGLALLLAAGLLTYGIVTASHETDSTQNSPAPKVTSAAALTEATPTPTPIPTKTPVADTAPLQILWQADSDSSGMYADVQTAINGQVYYSNNNTLYAASIDSGTVLWSYDKGRYPEIITDNSVYTISSSEHLVKLSADTGKQLWSMQVAKQPMEVGGHARMVGKTIIFANESGGVAAYNPDTGKQLWSNPDIPMYAGSIHDEHKGVLIVSSTIDNIRSQYFGLDPATGKQLWRTEGIFSTVTTHEDDLVLREMNAGQYERGETPVPGHLLTLVRLDSATGELTGQEDYRPLADIRQFGSSGTIMEQPYVYTVDGKPDQMESSLTCFTLGQTEDSSVKSYDEYGILLSGPTDGMAFFNQDNTLIGINLADDQTVTFAVPADGITLIQKQGNAVFASYDNGSFYLMDARTGAAAGRLDTGLSYNYFGNIITAGTTALVHFEQKCFAVSIPQSLLQ